jgi:hypothetical protein
MDTKELKEILEKHLKWLRGGSDDERANLDGANLDGANLDGANLDGASLRGVNLGGASLRWADLRWADLRVADLRWADLRGANLDGADLRGANLDGTNLRGANLDGTNLRGAKIKEDILIAYTSITPEGQLIGWKKCNDDVLVKISIPSESPRSNATGRKCRAKFVYVLEVIGAEKGVSQHDSTTEYIVGQRVECDNWDENRWDECSGGIHFFLTRYEAEQY